jgi:hypothetical protein
MDALMIATSASYDDDGVQDAMTAFSEKNLSMGFKSCLGSCLAVFEFRLTGRVSN